MMNKIYKKLLFATIIGLFGVSTMLIANQASADKSIQFGNATYTCVGDYADYIVPRGTTDTLCVSFCFVGNTQITMANGTTKNIQDVKAGDRLRGSKGINTVLRVIEKPSNSLIYSFNGGRFFVTDSHPFMTTEGWKSINPEATKQVEPELDVTELKVGDTLITKNGNTKLESIVGKDDPQPVYTFSVDGTNDYYADGYLVHNKYAPILGDDGSSYCPSGNYTAGTVNGSKELNCIISNPAATSCVDPHEYTTIACDNLQGFATVTSTNPMTVCYDGETLVSKVAHAPSAYIARFKDHGWTDKDGRFGTYLPGTAAAGEPYQYVYVPIGSNLFYLWDENADNWNKVCIPLQMPDLSNPDVYIYDDCYAALDGMGYYNPGFTHSPDSPNEGYCRNGNLHSCNFYATEGDLIYQTCVAGTTPPTPINGVCGSANGTTVSTAPTSNLCSVGTASAVGGSGPWARSCAGSNGGSTASCSANKATSGTPVDPTISWIPPQVVNPVQCSTTVLLVGACYMPASGSSDTTLLVRNGKVAINSTTVDSSAALLVNGAVRASSMINYSDIRLKANIQKIDNALEKVTKLNGYRFTWKDSGQPDFGVLAQEVEKVFADAVSTDDTGMKAVAYGQLLAPIIEAIKEINITIDAMTLKAQQQAERISALENK